MKNQKNINNQTIEESNQNVIKILAKVRNMTESEIIMFALISYIEDLSSYSIYNLIKEMNSIKK